MGGMPLLEVTNWYHQVSSLYVAVVPLFLYVNNILGPKVLEPAFTRDFVMAQFDKIASAKASIEGAGSAFAPAAGKAPRLPKVFFERAMRGGFRGGRLMALGARGLATMLGR
jgi:hypothetical protein